MSIRKALFSLALLGSVSVPSFAGENFIVDGLSRRDPSQSVYTQQESKTQQDRLANAQQERTPQGAQFDRQAASTAVSGAGPAPSVSQGANTQRNSAPLFNDLFHGGN